MMGLNGYLVFIALFVAAVTFALLGSWWHAGVCLVLTFVVFAVWPSDRSRQR